MKRFLFAISSLALTLCVFVPMSVMAVEVEINGLWYDVISKTKDAKVIKYKSSPYSGNIDIPTTVDYNGVACNVTSIADEAFLKCTTLRSVTIPNSVKTIGWRSFADCINLTSVAIGNGVTSIGDHAFSYCTHLTSATIPNSVTVIEAFAFEHTGLTSVTIPNGVTSIGGYAFSGCSGLSSVTIPNSVTAIGSSAFQDCSSLTSVTIPNSVTDMGGAAFQGCSSLTSVTIPNGVTAIGSSAFSGCSSLTSVTIPNSVTAIGSEAFYRCSRLPSIIIGSDIKTIGQLAFANCDDLAEVYCYAEKIPDMITRWGSLCTNAFQNSYIEYSTLHVPQSAIEDYRNTEPWSGFGTIVSIDGEEPSEQRCAKPTIIYQNGKLSFRSETEGVDFVSEIKNADIKKHYTSDIELTATYNISVYATKSGYYDSDIATATLCWIDATPQTEGLDGMAKIAARPILVKFENGLITVEGADDSTNVSIYATDGKQMGSAISRNNAATIATNLRPGSVAIVRVGEKSVKVVVK